ncbi:MAG: Two component regulator propeller [Ferruginibacter sp.]|nr:Two component regulator propeller [Ferruginibacter sp.]
MVTIRCLLLLLLLFFGCYFNANGQNNPYNFSKVDIESGLSHNQVNAIYRDDVGFVWFGTNSGLNRFDGYNFKISGSHG